MRSNIAHCLLRRTMPDTLSSSPILWTMGHSTRPSEEFLGLLQHHGIRQLADVRAIPFSGRNPQFNQEALEASLRDTGIVYRHMANLGGRRKAHKVSGNSGWRNASFRAYADYMQTAPFREAVESLIDSAQQTPTVIMCAEAVPWRCHRSLIADALVAHGWTVLEIIGRDIPKPHQLPAWARIDNGRVTYPAPTED
jgi:uncharacterized protein (DUF488 family)